MRLNPSPSSEIRKVPSVAARVLVVFIVGMLVVGDGLAMPALPSSVNWVALGAVAPVRDQGACGGDYATATAEAMDSLESISGRGLADVSEQQLLDCASAYGGHGCNGGELDTGFRYIVAHGIASRISYPYMAATGECKQEGGAVRISAYKTIPKGDCDALQAAVAHQPVMAVVDALNGFSEYSGGIFSSNSSNNNPNHTVLVVGYTPDYWLVQNSWGTRWGEQGYIRLKRGNTAGICDLAAYPINGTSNSSSTSTNMSSLAATAPPNLPNASPSMAIPSTATNVAPAATGVASDAIEIEYWHSIQNSTDPADFQSYLTRFPDGHFIELAHNRLVKLATPTDPCQGLLGKWKWFNNPEVDFLATGTVEAAGLLPSGKWTCKDGAVRIVWSFGMVDNLKLSSDGKHLSGRGGLFGLDVVTGDRL